MGKISLLPTAIPTLTDTVPGTDLDASNATKKFTIGSIVDLAAAGVTADVPATAASTGVKGQYSFDASFFYICIETDTWLRTSVVTW